VRALRGALVLAAALGLAACAIGPNYERPETPSPETYRGQVAPPEAASLADLPWWQVFDDPALVALARAALEHNLDLVQASARVEQSRALLGAARSQFYPQIGYQGHAGRARLPLTAEPGQDHTTFDTFFGAFSLAWEIDVWGRIRRASEAARAELFAAEYLRRGVLLSLVSEVASAYFELAGLDRELEISRKSAAAFQDTLDLFNRRYQGGVGSKLQTSRAEAALADAEAAIPELERQITAAENRINVLLARPPREVPRGAPLPEQKLPPQTPPGLPAQLLERRPDIVVAEEQIVAANARVGVAMGNFLPRIGLTAVYGGASSELSELVTGSASLWNVLGEAAGPLFEGGLRLAEYRAQKAVWEEAKAAYEQTVLVALAEVSDTLVAQEKLAEERAQREREVAALQESVDLALLRYRQGLAGYYEVLDAQQRLFPAERLLARVQTDQLTTVVRLYRALGGGWQLTGSWLP
jgi:multidrug efflux system outer membrane protein